MLLADINSPADLHSLDRVELDNLAAEIRTFLVDKVAATGGHLGPNLGVVELTLALHRVFDSPNDVIVWDTGHQAYVHKIVTGRQKDFAQLRQFGGISGYPARGESVHDFVENSHASTALSYSAGLVEAFSHTNESRRVIAVVGDGSLTGGMAYEALNQIAHLKQNLVIVLNDNGRSYSPTVGGLAQHLAQLRIAPLYQRTKRDVAGILTRLSRPGDLIAAGIHRLKGSVKGLVADETIFDSFGITYSGPIDGHDVEQVEQALRNASQIEGPVVVHLITTKGAGYLPAEEDQVDHWHGVSQFDPATGTPKAGPEGRTWTSVFGDALVQEAQQRDNVVAITAAMQNATGLGPFAEKFPERCYDVGIAEQHATTFAAGLAMGGLHPVVAVYATFMNRAIDQVLMDVGMHNLPVTFVLDRAGVTGNDGASHHGIFDIGFFRQVPGLVLAAPSDAGELRSIFHTALNHDGPFMIRMPKGIVSGDPTAPPRELAIGEWEFESAPGGVAIVAIGNMVEIAHKTQVMLEERGLAAGVTYARFIKPMDPGLADLARSHRLVVTIEDHEIQGGFGAAVLEELSEAGVTTPVMRCAIGEQFLPHGSVSLLHEQEGLTPEAITERIVARLDEMSVPA